jgi:hypothetical protein
MVQMSRLSRNGYHSNRISTIDAPPILSRSRHAFVGTVVEIRGYSASFFLLPCGHEALADSDKFVHWERQTSEAIIFYVTYIPSSVQAQMRSVTNHYRNDFSKTTQTFYWMNHCEHCGMKQGDFELFEEFDTPFCPINARAAFRILLRSVCESFSATATSITYESGYFERMKILR